MSATDKIEKARAMVAVFDESFFAHRKQELRDTVAALADLADAQAQEIARLKMIIARMDGAVPVADKTCDQPGITLSEAVMRQWPELRAGSGR